MKINNPRTWQCQRSISAPHVTHVDHYQFWSCFHDFLMEKFEYFYLQPQVSSRSPTTSSGAIEHLRCRPNSSWRENFFLCFSRFPLIFLRTEASTWQPMATGKQTETKQLRRRARSKDKEKRENLFPKFDTVMKLLWLFKMPRFSGGSENEVVCWERVEFLEMGWEERRRRILWFLPKAHAELSERW